MASTARVLPLLVLAFVCHSTIAAAAVKEIVIPWSDKIDSAAIKDGINRLHINADDSVSLRILHFNFLHYSLKVTVEERTIESYATLDRLWSQVFKLTSGALPELAGTSFDAAIVAWRRELAKADTALGDYTKTFAGRTTLTDGECADIGRNARVLGTDPIERVEALRRDALDKAQTSDDFDLYERILAQHRAVVERLSAFVTAADLVEHGWVEPLGKKKVASVVTFTITPLGPQGAAAGQPFQESYFVRSTRPLLLHVGYSASKLKDLKFDQVRSANGSDLFLATKASDTTQSLVTFLSYEFWRWGPTSEIGVQGTLGTSFQKPGENIFVGGGVRVTRFVISVGASGSGVQEGKGSVLDSVAGAAGARELFTTIATRQQWAPFFAISVRVY